MASHGICFDLWPSQRLSQTVQNNCQAAADACLVTENERIICNLNFTFRAENIRNSFTLVLS